MNNQNITIRITGKVGDEKVVKEIDISELAKEFDEVESAALTRNVDAGTLVARAFAMDEPYPAIEVDLELPEEANSLPVLISHTEQARESEDVNHNVRTFLYDRSDNYVAFMDADTRPDDEVDKVHIETQVVISGDPDNIVHGIAENPYVKLTY